MDFLYPSEAQKLIYTGQNIRLRHLRELGIGGVYHDQKRAFPPHFPVGVGDPSGQGPVGQLLAHDLAPVQRQIRFQTALAPQPVLEHLGDQPGQPLRLEGPLGGLARSFFAALAASSYILAQ